jgi:pimeloyl-ACP methyl ester carboxylesterase
VAKVRVRDVELNVYDDGSGDPLLFVHGFPLNHTMWQQQLKVFAESNRVIAPDLRGFGESDAVAGPLSMEQFAEDLNDLLDTLGVEQPICYCGLSMGGYIAWPFLQNYGGRVDSLVLCDTRSAADTAAAADNRRKLAADALENGSKIAAEMMLPKLISSMTLQENPQIAEVLRAMILATEPASIAAALEGMAVRRDATEFLREIQVPTLVVVGADDELTNPAEMRTLADQIPNSVFVEIPEAGHMSVLENPAAVNEAIGRFLSSLR